MRNCVPARWCEATIDDIAPYVQRGKSPKYADRSDLPVVNQKCIRWDGVDPQWLKFVHPDQWDQWADKRFLRAGDVLWNSTGTGTIGRACVFRGLAGYDRAVVDSHVTIVRCADYLPKLLLYWIMSPFVQSEIEGMQSGSTNQVELSKKEVLATSVLVPPLPEQHRIVEAIESYLTRLDDAVVSLERVQRNLERYRASVLKAAVEGRLVPPEAELARQEGRSYEPASELLKRILVERKTRWIENAAEKARSKAEAKALKAGKIWTFEDNAQALAQGRKTAETKYKKPAPPDLSALGAQAGTTDLPTLPEGWCWVMAEQLLPRLDGGNSATARDEPTGRRILRSSAVRQSSIDFTDHRYLAQDAPTKADPYLREGDVVFTRLSGSLAYVGNCAIVPDLGNEKYEFPDRLFRGQLVGSLDARYFHHCFAVQELRTQLEAAAKSAAGHQRIGLDDLRRYLIPLPPEAEQRRIAEEAESVLSSASRASSTVEIQIARASRLRQAVLKWAFEGKLVEQDPDDEPASVLLERIKAERASEPSGVGR